jgi:hypothetical protein
VDLPTVLASGGLSALVAVITATRVASRTERGRHIYAARQELRAVVDDSYRLARQTELGHRKPTREPDRGVDGGDYVLAGRVLAVAAQLPWWQRRLIHRRCRRLFGRGIADLAEVQPADTSSFGGMVAPLLTWQYRQSKGGKEPLKRSDVHGLMDALATDAPATQLRKLRRSLARLRAGW